MLKDRFREAISLHRAGSVEQAEEIYRDLLREDPEHAGAWHLLGVVLHSRRDLPGALEYIEKALSLCDFKAVYWNNYGAVLKDLGRQPQAREAFERAVSLDADYADAWSNLGLIQADLGERSARPFISNRSMPTLCETWPLSTVKKANSQKPCGCARMRLR